MTYLSTGKKMFMAFTVILLTVFLDQAGKFYIDNYLDLTKPIFINNYFNIVKAWNTGVSFSLFSGYGEYGRYALIVFALLVVGFLLHWLYKETDSSKAFSIALIVGGAIGNVIDRVRLGAVIDFLDFHYADIHWPAFNFADTFICLGVFVLISIELKDIKKKGLNEV